MSADGVLGTEIATRLDLTPEEVSRIRPRFRDDGVAGLAERPKTGRKDNKVPPETVERVIQLAMSPPPAGRSRWTTRLLAKVVGLTSGCVSKLLRKHGLKPHLVRTYKVSGDPAFAEKVEDVVGLYLDPPEQAIVLGAKLIYPATADPAACGGSPRWPRENMRPDCPSALAPGMRSRAFLGARVFSDLACSGNEARRYCACG
ncbi:MAG TPA: helix-turn-helix domain-containing protein [Kofleriaceae bacterium]|nr:helix-turn-helix domain-containing protein [Kofleriaceae bacterium]